MLLAIDVGNTNITYGLFKGRKLVKIWREKTQEWGKGPAYVRLGRTSAGRQRARGKKTVQGVIVTSVVPKLDKPLARALKRRFGLKPVFATYRNIPLSMKLRKKTQVGADRLVNAYAASTLYGTPAIIVDFGTATTFCAVNAKGEYLGGAIAPGIRLSAEALHSRTAKLPLVDFGMARRTIGRDTRSAMLSGLYFGYVSLVEGMVSRFGKKLGKMTKVVATGGYSTLIGKKTRVFDIIDPDLTLKGLRLVWEGLDVRRTK